MFASQTTSICLKHKRFTICVSFYDDLRGNLVLSNCFKVLYRVNLHKAWVMALVQGWISASDLHSSILLSLQWQSALLIYGYALHSNSLSLPLPCIPTHPSLSHNKYHSTLYNIPRMATIEGKSLTVCNLGNMISLCTNTWIWHHCTTVSDLLSVQWDYSNSFVSCMYCYLPRIKLFSLTSGQWMFKTQATKSVITCVLCAHCHKAWSTTAAVPQRLLNLNMQM